jgi:hypothetical protein
MTDSLKDVLERVKTWPEQAQADLAEIVLDMEVALRSGSYRASPEELQAIDEADRAGIARDEEIEAAFATFRRG